jgi:hypothetical protein
MQHRASPYVFAINPLGVFIAYPSQFLTVMEIDILGL